MQATLLCLFPLASLVGVELSARRERTLYVASLFALVAYGTFWLAIVVLSDLVNLPLTPIPIWAGVLFGLALALAYGFGVILAARWSRWSWRWPDRCFRAPASRGRLPSTGPIWERSSRSARCCSHRTWRVSITSFGPATRLTALLMGFSGLLLLANIGDMSLFPASNTTVQIFYQVVMLVAGIAALVIGVRRQMSETVRTAATALSLFLLIRFIDWFWDALPAYAFFFALAALAFGWLLVLRRIRGRLSGHPIGRPAALGASRRS